MTDTTIDTSSDASLQTSAGTLSAADRGAGGQTMLRAVFALTVFLSAFLLFQVQPMVSKFILPWFGGSPGVWTTCMLVFQMLLFAGYAYAHFTIRTLNPLSQAVLHIAILAVAATVAYLYIIPSADWKPAGDADPSLKIVGIVCASVGLPFFALSATGPLLQAWFSRALAGQSPYRLYALSNAGSLLALISYPFIVEPRWPVDRQAAVWANAFVVFAVLCGIIGLLSRRGQSSTVAADLPGGECQSPPTVARRLLWFALGMTPSVMLLATTNKVCLDVASAPFLWIVPLALYLLSFILCFDGVRWYKRGLWLPLLAIAAALSACALAFTPLHAVAEATLFFATLFCLAMFCHGELARIKPAPRHLTSFYLILAAAGAAGGLFVSLVAPRLFSYFAELQLAIFAALLLAMVVLFMDPMSRLANGRPKWAWRVIILFVSAVGIGLGYSAVHARFASVLTVRNFYGVMAVHDAEEPATKEPCRRFTHGTTLHGRQSLVESHRREPTQYYARGSGIGAAMQYHDAERPREIGVVGLGAGTLAAYGNEGDHFRFYEIDRDVVPIAENYFTYLADSPAEYTIVLGDARLSLESEVGRTDLPPFDVLVADAFSSDSIPMHLLTRKAMELYFQRLRPDGILALHISNRYLDLRPVVACHAAEMNLTTRIYDLDESDWVLLSRDPQAFAPFGFGGPLPLTVPPSEYVRWTDDYCSLWAVMRPLRFFD